MKAFDFIFFSFYLMENSIVSIIKFYIKNPWSYRGWIIELSKWLSLRLFVVTHNIWAWIAFPNVWHMFGEACEQNFSCFLFLSWQVLLATQHNDAKLDSELFTLWAMNYVFLTCQEKAFEIAQIAPSLVFAMHCLELCKLLFYSTSLNLELSNNHRVNSWKLQLKSKTTLKGINTMRLFSVMNRAARWRSLESTRSFPCK